MCPLTDVPLRKAVELRVEQAHASLAMIWVPEPFIRAYLPRIPIQDYLNVNTQNHTVEIEAIIARPLFC